MYKNLKIMVLQNHPYWKKINDILIDDASSRDIIISEVGNVVKVRVVAEDYKTTKEFIFNVKTN